MAKTDHNCNGILLVFFQQSSQNFSDQAQLCRISLSKKNIHNLRLALKNLKAYCELLDAILPRKPVKKSFPETFDQILDVLGSLRDLQVAEKTLDSLSSELKISLKKLKLRLSKLRKGHTIFVHEQVLAFQPEAELAKIAAKTDRLLARQTGPESLKPQFIKYIHETVRNITSLTSLRHSERVLHKIRSYVKSLYFTVQVFSREPWFAEMDHIRPEFLNQVQIELGEWHDLTVIKVILQNLNRPAKKEPIKPWKIYVLEEYVKKKQTARIKQINSQMLPHLFDRKK